MDLSRVLISKADSAVNMAMASTGLPSSSAICGVRLGDQPGHRNAGMTSSAAGREPGWLDHIPSLANGQCRPRFSSSRMESHSQYIFWHA